MLCHNFLIGKGHTCALRTTCVLGGYTAASVYVRTRVRMYVLYTCTVHVYVRTYVRPMVRTMVHVYYHGRVHLDDSVRTRVLRTTMVVPLVPMVPRPGKKRHTNLDTYR